MGETLKDQPRLAAGVLGLHGQLFQSISHMAPAVGVIFSAPFMAGRGGGSLALAWALATVACLMTAFCLVELVRKVRSAGGYFVIHSVALGHFAGFTTSWLWFLFEPLAPASLAMLFGWVLERILKERFGLIVPWWCFAAVILLILSGVSLLGIQHSARLTVVLGLVEIGVMLVLGIAWVVRAGANQPLISFLPASSPHGWGGVFFATVYAVLSFLGFESGLPLAEESHNPRRSLIVSILVSCSLIGLFYVFLGYATVAGWGYTDADSFAESFSEADRNLPFFQMGSDALGTVGFVLVLLVLANSAFACSIAAQNAVTRVFFSLGRAEVFPRWLSRVHPRTRTPINAVFLEVGIAFFFAFFGGFVFGPFEAFGLIGALFSIGGMTVYSMTNISTFTVYFFKHRSEFSIVRHLVIPVLGTIALIFPLCAALYPPLFGVPNDYPVSLALPISAGWFLIGVVFYFCLRRRNPQSLERLANEMSHVELVGEK